ncbi:flagellar operon protein (TIGR03826 family) [Streptohalobacillus salinus]|uniref:Flagellar operon protein (TIGR03826 family) n=1 Tax=Streptohalobacillus salinus TaxID=621096 RepID=A0A2V3WK10_9BACI|nr:TIGR03826 family flagellar region protein [Streptohalobacillus salinus]PXW93008.1 flagellar operon protein (TIGR03826 family) [Streptohalobacillus salinus]
MGQLENCPRCGDLFVKTTRDVCQKCYKEEEEKFDIVYRFMKKRVNREARIPEIVEGTGVEEDLIIKFVKEKRLRVSQFPNMTYPCERCGKEIAEGKLCASCSGELTGDLKQLDSIESIKRQREKEDNKAQTYFAVDKGRRKP